MTAKDILRVNAFKWPDKKAIRDLYRSYTFGECNERACRLANGLYDMGLRKGDRFAVLAYNCVEWMLLGAVLDSGSVRIININFPA
jgi:acyl-CoA synthetase (AMP-forming)/AMP-acid ligase II